MIIGVVGLAIGIPFSTGAGISWKSHRHPNRTREFLAHRHGVYCSLHGRHFGIDRITFIIQCGSCRIAKMSTAAPTHGQLGRPPLSNGLPKSPKETRQRWMRIDGSHRQDLLKNPIADSSASHMPAGRPIFTSLGLICFHHPLEIQVLQLPGRPGRMNEAPIDEIAPIVEAATQAIEPLTDLPYAFYGHSMGSLVAYEVTRNVWEEYRHGPTHLFVAARRAPHLISRNQTLHHQPAERSETFEKSPRRPGRGAR